MVCKEEFVLWFKDLASYKRVDLICTLLKMCLPFELRFFGTYIEELGKLDFTGLREVENRANNATEVADAQSVSDKHTRRKLALYLALLNSANYGCSNVLFKTLANCDFAEIQGGASEDDEELHRLDELLLLYTMALNHPAFTFEQKSAFGSIFMKLQEEEAIASCPVSKSGAMGMQPVRPAVSRIPSLVWQSYVPTAYSDSSPGGANQHFATTLQPILMPSTNLPGDAGKNMPMQDMAGPTYIQLSSCPNTGSPNSVLYYSLQPHEFAQAVTTPTTPSASEYSCPQASSMVPTMGGEFPSTSGISATNCLPSATNPEYTSFRSPYGSPPGSPVASRSGSPGWVSSTSQAANACYKGGPPRHGSSSSSSSCSGGSTGGYRRNTPSRNKQQAFNGQPPAQEEVVNQNAAEQPRLPTSEEQLHGILANMSIANGVCDTRQEQHVREEKRRWQYANMAGPPPHNSGSAGSSQSESPSPPRSPPQEENWDQGKDEAARWEKMQAGMPAPLLCSRTGVGPRAHAMVSSSMPRRPQDLKTGVLGRRPTPNMAAAMPVAVYPTAQGMQPHHASTGAIYPANPTYLSGTALYSMMPQHGSGPASFPPFTPNGITSPPPEMIYAVPPSSQTSPPPYPVQQQFAAGPVKPSSPPPNFMPYPPNYPPPPISTNTNLTCYNCGGSNHRGTECREPSIEEVMRRGQYRLDYSSPQTSVDQGAPPQQQSSSGGSTSSSGSGTGTAHK